MPGPPLVREGAEFDVDVRVDAAGLYGAQLGLAFDPALREVVSVAASGAGTPSARDEIDAFLDTLSRRVLEREAAKAADEPLGRPDDIEFGRFAGTET